MKRGFPEFIFFTLILFGVLSCNDADDDTPPPATAVPVLTTLDAINIGSNSAESGGEITSAGNSEVIQRGICWDTLPNPTTENFTTNDGTGVGTFTSALIDLELGKTYFLRAYAINASGTGYGNGKSFTTFGPFAVVQPFAVSATNVDFSTGQSVFFSADFNQESAWTIEITGTESGAFHTISGTGQSINNTNATWSGNTTDLPFFKQESCTATLVVEADPDYNPTLEINVLGPITYTDGILLTDFETFPSEYILMGDYQSEFTSATGQVTDVAAAQGQHYLFLEGTDDVIPDFFVGLFNIRSTITGQPYIPLPDTDPSNLYFNCFIQHDGSPHTIAVIQFVYDSNDNGIYDEGADQTFQVEGDFPLNHTGWRHLSHPMSATGISQGQLDKIVTVRIILISNGLTQPIPPDPVGFGIDYLIFTQGGPLEL